MFAASRYVAILVIVLSAGYKKVISQPVQYNLQTDAESPDYFTILNIYDWFYSILNEDDDDDMNESEESYPVICRNCTIVVQQSGSAISNTPPGGKPTSMLYNNKTVNIQTVESPKTETKDMKNPEAQSTSSNMETAEVELTATTLTTVSQEG